MSARCRLGLTALGWRLSCGALLFTSAGCSRVDVYPVTGQSEPDASNPQPEPTAPADDVTLDDVTLDDVTLDDVTDPADNTTDDDGADAGSGVTCPSSVVPAGDSVQTLTVDSLQRSYVLHVPSTYTGTSPAPLVLDFHGVGESGASERESSPYPAALDPEGVVMAFPDGLRGPAGTAWNVGPCCVEDVDDLAFARAVVEHVKSLTCIDERRVYAVGVLTGGGMAYSLACHAADVFAAVAPAAFDLLEENVDECVPSRPVSVISFRGTAPSRVPYEGGPSMAVPGMPITFLGAQASFEAWGRINSCATVNPEDANGCASYSGCAGGAEVILCTEPGGAEEPGDPNLAWPVLARHTL